MTAAPAKAAPAKPVTAPVATAAVDGASTQPDLQRTPTAPDAAPPDRPKTQPVTAAPAPPRNRTEPLAAPPGAPAAGGLGAMPFYPADLDRALGMAIKKTRTRPTKRKMADVAAYYAVGDELNIAREEMEAALHAVALEKMKGIGPSSTAMFFRSPRINTIYNALRIVEPKSRKERIKLTILASIAILLVATTIVLAAVAWRQSGIRKEHEAELDRQRQEVLARPMSMPEPVLGTIDKVAFNTAVAGVTVKLQACATSVLKEQLTTAATYRVSARIDLEGKLSEIKVRDPLNNDTLRSCIEKEVAAHPFPKAEKAPVDIEFAATFEPPAKGAPTPAK